MPEVLLGYLLLFFARVFDVSLGTMRTLLLVRGRRQLAAAIGFVEVIIYVLTLNFVFQRLDSPISLLFYGAGFATGNLVGSWLEDKLAFGFVTAQVITLCEPHQLGESLRQEGFGVTVIEGYGKEGCRQVLNVIMPRKRLARFHTIIQSWDTKAFVTLMETRAIRGGFYGRLGKK